METQDDSTWDVFTQAFGHVIFALSSYENIHSMFCDVQNQPKQLSRFHELISLIVKDVEEYRTTIHELEQSLQREIERRNEQVFVLEEEMHAQIRDQVETAKQEEKIKMEEESARLKETYELQLQHLQESVKNLKLVEQKLSESTPIEREVEMARERILEISAEKSDLTTKLNEAESTIILLRSQVSSLLFDLQEKSITVDRGQDELNRSSMERDHMAHQVHTLLTDNRRLRDSHDEMQEVLQIRYSQQTTPNLSLCEDIPPRLSIRQRHSSADTSFPNSVLDQDAFAECDPALNYMATDSDECMDGDASIKSSVDIMMDSGIGIVQEDVVDRWRRSPTTLIRRSSPYRQRNSMRRVSRDRLSPVKYDDATSQEMQEDFSEDECDIIDRFVPSPPQHNRTKSHRTFQRNKQKRVISPDPELLTGGPLYKIVLCGDICVGKSSFMFRACNNSFKKHIRSTLGVDFQNKTLKVTPSRTITVQLWDTAGQERFRSLTSSYFRRANGVILLYDVTNPASFLNVKDWMETITSSSAAGTPVMICGNKVDLRNKSHGRSQPVVYQNEGAQLAANYGALFMETSAALGENVEAALKTLGRHLQGKNESETGLIYDLKEHSEKENESSCCLTPQQKS